MKSKGAGDGRRSAFATGPRSRKSDRRCRRRGRACRAAAQPAQGADRIPASRIRAIRAGRFPMPSSASSPPSIKQHGVIQPIVVRPVKGATGSLRDHRRRTALARGATRQPARSADRPDRSQRLRRARDHDHRERAARRPQRDGRGAGLSRARRTNSNAARKTSRKNVGKSRSHVANMMRLTKLPAEVQAYIADGQIIGGPRPRADRRARSGGGGEAHRRGRSERSPDRGAGA